MDMVFTHTSNEYNMLYRAEPYYRYYFRTNGASWQNVGTGNWIDDDKTNKPFAYKMVVDSALYWIKEFHIDGIRFDLVVGTREETLKEIQKKLCNPNGSGVCQSYTDSLGNTIKPPNFLTGENWLGATRHSFMVQSGTNDTLGSTGIDFTAQVTGDYPGFSQWNDYFRESVKAFVQGNSDPMYTSRTKTAMYFSKNRDDGIWQAISKNPVDTLNYIESHDEETIFHAVLGNEFKAALGMLTLLVSHGIPMIQQGQEFFRDKGKQDQSYSGNVIKWGGLSSNKKMFYLTKYLIDMRKSCAAFQYAADPTVTNSNFDSSTVNQTYSFFTKGTACSGSSTTQLNGRTEFRVLANMTNTTQTFTVETGGSRWCAFVHIADADGTESSPQANFSVISPPSNSGLTDIASWGYTTSTWALNAYSAVILSKISATGTCSSP
ncbi:MAG: hypothetical protein D6767_10500 [Candidatus Hydrogenedentota bacterium]|nr:MAG: hypothetical protein D6767_10500 [Candidatus Hydrogenedentota bacterium]